MLIPGVKLNLLTRQAHHAIVDTTAGREFTPDVLWLRIALDMLRANARNFSIMNMMDNS